MKTTIIHTPDGRNVQSDMIGNAIHTRVIQPVIYPDRKKKKPRRENILDKKFPEGEKVDLPLPFMEPPKKKRGRPKGSGSVHYPKNQTELRTKKSIPVFPPRPVQPPPQKRKIPKPEPQTRWPPLPPIVTVRRPCMTCAKPFNSEGKHNRLCNFCRHQNND